MVLKFVSLYSGEAVGWEYNQNWIRPLVHCLSIIVGKERPPSGSKKQC